MLVNFAWRSFLFGISYAFKGLRGSGPGLHVRSHMGHTANCAGPYNVDSPVPSALLKKSLPPVFPETLRGNPLMNPHILKLQTQNVERAKREIGAAKMAC